jgi:16S rRNA (cytidine1402-2'-O)-methyltransferase
MVATPIGNLEDMTMRAVRVLNEVDYILCEDTRVTKHLLDHYKIDKPLISYHQHSNLHKTDEILGLLSAGKNLALVTDAGTPGISDPGGKLVQLVLERFGEDVYPVKSPQGRGAAWPQFDRVKIESVPGASAVTAALSISGVLADKFVFLGFPPHKKGRQTFLRKIIESEYPAVVYESKYRIIKFLEELKKAETDYNQEVGLILNKAPKEKIRKVHLTSVVVCRELSKMFETVYRGESESIIEKIKNDPNAQKGEFVVVVGK